MKYERQCRVVQERHQQGSAGGGIYTVRTGDTLQAIAASLYGDGNLWYRIAEANGLSGAGGLNEGQQLRLPAGTGAPLAGAAVSSALGVPSENPILAHLDNNDGAIRPKFCVI